MRFKAKKVVRFRANQITGTTSDFKMGVTFFCFCFFNRLFLRKAGGREVDIRSVELIYQYTFLNKLYVALHRC